MRLPALTLPAPWASLVAHGLKKYVTRSWAPRERIADGILAIHAGKTCDREAWHWFASSFPEIQALTTIGKGEVLAIVRVLLVWRTEDVEITTRERAFGNFRPGRYAWQLEVVHKLDPPVAARGQQGIWQWDVPGEVESVVTEIKAGTYREAGR